MFCFPVCFHCLLDITLEKWFVVVLWVLDWMCLLAGLCICFCRVPMGTVRKDHIKVWEFLAQPGWIYSKYNFTWGPIHGYNLPRTPSFPFPRLFLCCPPPRSLWLRGSRAGLVQVCHYRSDVLLASLATSSSLKSDLRVPNCLFISLLFLKCFYFQK